MTDPSPPPKQATPRIELIAYDRDRFVRTALERLADAAPYLRDESLRVWLDVEGLQASALIEELQTLIALHPMAADLLRNGTARALVEDYGNTRLATMMFVHDLKTSEVIDFLFNERILITIQERPGDCFDSVRTRLETNAGRVRDRGAGFLFALLGRAICDSYQPILERFAARISKVESALARRPERGLFTRIHSLRSNLLQLRQQIVPLQESLHAIVVREATAPGAPDEIALAMRSLANELAELRDVLDFHRDEIQRLADLFQNSVSNRLNDVMRILTIISTLFMPLSFLASLYGMNFDRGAGDFNMPELGWRYGYITVLGVMCLVSLSLVIFFWRKGWLSDPAAERRHGIDGLALDMVEFIGLSEGPATRVRRRRRPTAPVRARAAEPPQP